jgi:hypothetical protein
MTLVRTEVTHTVVTTGSFLTNTSFQEPSHQPDWQFGLAGQSVGARRMAFRDTNTRPQHVIPMREPDERNTTAGLIGRRPHCSSGAELVWGARRHRMPRARVHGVSMACLGLLARQTAPRSERRKGRAPTNDVKSV